MEAWNFIDHSTISPLFALGFTTERWGLEPFPGNLIATSSQIPSIQTSNGTSIDQAWELPYSCPYSPFNKTYPASKIYADRYRYGLLGNEDQYLELNSSIGICDSAKACPSSDCYVLMQGVGATTIGPANSNIVGLTHGIATLITIIATILFVIMGCGPSKVEQVKPYDPQYLQGYYNPPPRHIALQKVSPPTTSTTPGTNKPNNSVPPAVTGSNHQAKEVARVAELLRQMYTLDIAIWAAAASVEDEDQQEREKNMIKADALFAEIGRSVRKWRASEVIEWSEEEWRQIQKVCEIVGECGVRRYT